MAPEATNVLNLPVSVSSPTDVARLKRELDGLDEHLRQESLRRQHAAAYTPRISGLLDELASANGIDLTEATARQRLMAFVAELEQQAPVVRISFAVDPSPEFVQKIVQWFRGNIHPLVLVRVGLQPNIAAGCVVRTTNRYHDCSLREQLKHSRSALIEALGAPIAAG